MNIKATSISELINILEHIFSGEKHSPIKGFKTVVETARGMEAKVQYIISELSDLVPSHDLLGKQNKNFPDNYQNSTRNRIKARLQTRDRSSKSSMSQITRISGNLRPRLLGASALASDGAPIVDSKQKQGKFIIISGNGRALSIMQAVSSKNEGATKYRNWLIDEAKNFGFDPIEVQAFQFPVLVRNLQNKFTPEELTKFVKEANKPSTLAPSAEEIAIEDASELSSEMIALAAVGKDGRISGRKNSEFVRLFLEKVLDNDPAEVGRMVNNRGLTDEGADRITKAVFMRAYGDSRLLDKLVTRGDDESKKLTQGLLLAAPNIAKLADRIDKNGRYDLDVAADIVGATQEISFARKKYKGSAKKALNAYLSQISIDDIDLGGDEKPILEHVKDLIMGLVETGMGNKGSAEKTQKFLNRYVKLANDALDIEETAGDSFGFDVFGPGENTTKEEMIRTIKKEVWTESAKEARKKKVEQPYTPIEDLTTALLKSNSLRGILETLVIESFTETAEETSEIEVERSYTPVEDLTVALTKSNTLRGVLDDLVIEPMNEAIKQSYLMKWAENLPEEGEIHTKKKKFKLQGRRQFQGFQIAIENKKGSIRRGKDKNKPWETKMTYDYGYIPSVDGQATEGVDGDAFDVFVGDNPKAEYVYIVHQHNIGVVKEQFNKKLECPKCEKHAKDCSCKFAYDEDKGFLGFDSKEQVAKAYTSLYDHEGFLGPISTYKIEDFRKTLSMHQGKRLPLKS